MLSILSIVKVHSNGDSSVCFSHAWVHRKHLGQDVLGLNTGIGSVLPHGTQQQPSGEDGVTRSREEAHRLGKRQ